MTDELELAYAITIHKATGKRISGGYYPSFTGPKFYITGICFILLLQGAKKCLTIVGSESVFQEMIHNTNQQNRNTSLAERIRELNES